jgi:hypothetical protein
VDLRFELDRFRYFGSRLVEIAQESKRPREAQMNAKVPRICGVRLAQEFDRLIQMLKKEVAQTQRRIRNKNIRCMRTEPDRFLNIGDASSGFPIYIKVNPRARNATLLFLSIAIAVCNSIRASTSRF